MAPISCSAAASCSASPRWSRVSRGPRPACEVGATVSAPGAGLPLPGSPGRGCRSWTRRGRSLRDQPRRGCGVSGRCDPKWPPRFVSDAVHGCPGPIRSARGPRGCRRDASCRRLSGDKARDQQQVRKREDRHEAGPSRRPCWCEHTDSSSRWVRRSPRGCLPRRSRRSSPPPRR